MALCAVQALLPSGNLKSSPILPSSLSAIRKHLQTPLPEWMQALACLVGLSGLEPPTSRLSGVRSNRLSYKPIFPGFEAISVSSATIAVGGDKRDRTVDLLLAKQALSQLSYTPM